MRVQNSAQGFYQMTQPLRSALESVQVQMATGQKAATYGDLGVNTQSWLNFAQAQEQAKAFMDGISRHQLRLKMMDSALTGLTQSVASARTIITSGPNALASGKSTAENALSMMTDLLNAKNGTQPLFAGSAISGDAAITGKAMLDGDGTQPGLRALIQERILAETGGGTAGRLTLTSTATTATLTQSGGAFGFRVLSANSNSPGISLSGPIGTPLALTIVGSGVVTAGEKINVKLGLPDGSEQTVTLTVGEDGVPAGSVSGSILASALSTKIAGLTPALKTAAAMRVAQDYFAGSVQRVSGTPASSAIALSATPTSIPWYKRQASADPRHSVTALVGDGQTLYAGAQANEAAFQSLLAPMAALTVLVEDPTMQTSSGQEALQNALLPRLDTLGVSKLQVEFGLIQKQFNDANAIQSAAQKIADEFLSKKNRADTTELAAQVLTLQNQLQASYQAGANIMKLSLVNYL